jgi:hypothetical protein
MNWGSEIALIKWLIEQVPAVADAIKQNLEFQDPDFAKRIGALLPEKSASEKAFEELSKKG